MGRCSSLDNLDYILRGRAAAQCLRWTCADGRTMALWARRTRRPILEERSNMG